ncbi:unnamed protein product, partial [Closterium sp. NIES-54]
WRGLSDDARRGWSSWWRWRGSIGERESRRGRRRIWRRGRRRRWRRHIGRRGDAPWLSAN